MVEVVMEMTQVTKRYGTHTAVADLSLSVQRGEIIGLLGPNGAGKTTTIRLFNGVIKPDSGQIRVLGLDPQDSGDQVRAKTGVLTESAGLYEGMSAEGNLQFFAALYGLSERESNKRIRGLLSDFGLGKVRDKPVAAFSTGMKKRLAIARALLHQPELLFLDEPTNGLDPEGSRSLIRYIQDLNHQYGVTMLICTHLLRQVQDLCHRYILIDQGRLLEAGTLRELEERHPGPVRLEVETPLRTDGECYHGYVVSTSRAGYLVFELKSREQIPELLRQVLTEAPVYEAKVLGRDLETLYFRIRGETHE